MTYDNLAKEFPTYDQTALPAIPEGFEDVSWHNDTCPMFQHDGAGLALFIDFRDRKDREFQERDRFAVKRMTMGEDGWELTDEGEYFASDDWAVICAYIAQRMGV